MTSDHGVHLPGPPAHDEGQPGRERVDGDEQGHHHRHRDEREVHPLRKAFVAQGQAGPHRPDPLGHPGARHRRQEQHEQGEEHRGEVEELVRVIDGQDGVEHQRQEHTGTPGASTNQQDRDGQLDGRRADDDDVLQPGGPVELQA